MSLGFIILRHVNDNNTNKYWQYSYDCIRKFYPENSIIIIDDNSDVSFLTKKELYKTTVINSEYSKRGELLPYYYYLKNKLFDTAVIIHDSVFIQKYIDFSVDKYKIIWDFTHHWDEFDDEVNILKIFNDKDLINFHQCRELWTGCFGAMSIITHNFLSEINDKYDLSKLLDIITNRTYRCHFERILACLLQFNYIHKNESDNVLLCHIHDYVPWGVTFEEKDEYTHLPILKVWTGR